MFERLRPGPTAVLLLALGLAVSAWLGWRQGHDNRQLVQQRFDVEAQNLVLDVVRRADAIARGMRGVRAFAQGTGPDGLSQQGFLDYLATRDLAAEFPGLTDARFQRRVAEADLPAFVQRARRELGPSFQLSQARPQGGERYVVRVVSDLGLYQAALGFDSLSDPQRASALRGAVRSGEVLSTASLPGSDARLNQAGRVLVVYLGTYRLGAPLANEAEREAAAVGVTSALVSVDRLLADAATLRPGLVLALTDTDTDGGEPAARKPPPQSADGTGPASWLGSETMLGRRWQFEVSVGPDYAARQALTSPWLPAGQGLLATALLALLSYLALANRGRAAVEATVRLRTDELDAARHDLQSMLDAVPILIAKFDRHGVNCFANRVCYDWFKLPEGSIPGMRHRDLLGAPTYDHFEAAVLGALNGRSHEEELSRLRSDGALRHTLLRILPDQGPQGVQGYYVVLNDVTDLVASRLQLAGALRDNEVLLGTLHRYALVSISDGAGRIIDINEAFCRVSGYHRDELLGQDHRLLSAGTHPPDFWAEMWRTLVAGQAWHGQICNRAKDGSLYWVNSMIAPFVDADGRLERLVSIRTDITATMLSQQSLAYSEARFRTLSDSAPLGVYATDTQGRCTYTNLRWQAIYGLDAEQALGRGWMASLHPDDRVSVFDAFRDSATTQREFDLEFRVYRPNTALRHVHARANPLRDAAGTITGYVGTVEDVTERRELLDRLAANEALLNRTGAVAGVGGWELDMASQRMTWTRQMYVLHEVADDFVLTLHSALSFYAPAARAQIDAALAACLAGQSSWSLELPLTTAKGRTLWLQSQGEALREQGEITRMQGAVQDITARREAAEFLRQAQAAAEAANRAKTAFLANMSHEIRTPLNAIVGLSYLLARRSLAPEDIDLVARISDASSLLVATISDVLDISKIESGELKLDLAPFVPAQLLETTVRLFAAQAKAKGLAFSLQVAPAADAMVLGDATRYGQIMANLLSNALKFTARGHIAVDLQAEPLHAGEPPGQLRLSLSVADTGIGIDAEAQARLFRPFVQADSSTTRRYGGTGLGLSIVHELVQVMDGQISLHSAPGVGSRFTVTLTLPFDADLSQPGRLQFAGLSVLVAEDDATQCAALLQMAAQLGWRAKAVASGAALVAEVLARQRSGEATDVLIVDWQMPGVPGALGEGGQDGLAALAQLHQQLDAAALPVVLMTSADDVAALRSAPNDRWATHFLLKPRTVSDLFNAMADALHADPQRRDRLQISAEAHASDMLWLPGVRLLLTDDSELNRDVGQRILRLEGAEVVCCASGQQALDLLRATPDAFDAVLMDLQMPDMDGCETTRQIRGIPGLASLPVIALTASVLASERQRAQDAGMDGFVAKPLAPKVLVRMLRKLIGAAQDRPLPIQSRSPADLTAQALSSAPPWPDIMGIAGPDVARRLGGDAALFLDMLRRLLREFADLGDGPASVELPSNAAASTSADAPAALPSGERARLAARMHKLAGSASIVGAVGIESLAAALETQLRAGSVADAAAARAATNDGLRALAGAMVALQLAARPWLAQLAAGEADSTHAASGLDDAAEAALPAASAINEFIDLLQRQDLSAVKRFKTLGHGLRQLLGADRHHKLRTAIDDYDFAAALAVVKAD